ncbi:DUF2303 family protein [Accumulibacter sp.]|jgi:uncharacterized protein YfdQ (DUF2303 family)|uniref:DUF2303 family protein n=1 Tax=Accumulibacter sp. TaxID=2053492 RepID=UPI002C627F65|nr:DUF2303 family protein [Accumulibacter sp.]HRF06309.1 DUF2303 family protein [Accumulibacter sp.]
MSTEANQQNRCDYGDAFAAGMIIGSPRLPTVVQPSDEHMAVDVGRSGTPYVILPPGCTVADLEKMLPKPARKRAAVICTDTDGFVTYVNRHSDERTSIYAHIDEVQSIYKLVAVLDDHGADRSAAGWRAHTCRLLPVLSVEWARWTGSDRKVMAQADFAAWLEDNRGDIASVDGMPSGAQILEMALAFEATADKRLRSKINLGNGGVNLEYVDDEDEKTRTTMRFFERFTLGLPVFSGSDSGYPLEARLKYRNNSGKLAFWYELIRPDKVFLAAVNDSCEQIEKNTDLPIIAGMPWL